MTLGIFYNVLWRSYRCNVVVVATLLSDICMEWRSKMPHFALVSQATKVELFNSLRVFIAPKLICTAI